MPIRYGDANAMRTVLQNVMSRQGGSVKPVQQPQYLLACDRADRLMRIIDTVEAMETEGARRTTRTYELPAGIAAASVVQAFAVICPERFSNAPAAAAADNSIVVRGTPELLAQCDELFKQLTAN